MAAISTSPTDDLLLPGVEANAGKKQILRLLRMTISPRG